MAVRGWIRTRILNSISVCERVRFDLVCLLISPRGLKRIEPNMFGLTGLVVIITMEITIIMKDSEEGLPKLDPAVKVESDHTSDALGPKEDDSNVDEKLLRFKEAAREERM